MKTVAYLTEKSYLNTDGFIIFRKYFDNLGKNAKKWLIF